MTTPQPPDALKADQAAAIFAEFAAAEDMALRFPADGCSARTHLMVKRLLAKGLAPLKVCAFAANVGDFDLSKAKHYDQRMFLSRDEVRELDRRAIEEFGVPGVVLMENAGRGAAELLLRLGARGLVVVCCGKGNNGGDGFVIARHLDNHGIGVRVLLFARPEDLEGDAAIHYQIIARAGLPITIHEASAVDASVLCKELAPAEWIVDALFGTGLRGGVRPPFDHIISAINDSPAQVLAVDIPSGLDCDTGRPLGVAVRADHTATFVAQKKGFAEPAAAEWLGQVHVVDIGMPRRLLSSRPRP